MSKRVPSCAQLYVHLAVPALCHHVLAPDRAWAFCAHHAGHRTAALSRVRSLFLTSCRGTGPGTGNLSTRMRVFPEREIALAFLTGRLKQRRLFSGASPPCARSWSHPVVAPHRTRLGVVHHVRLLVHPPFVTSRRVTLPCPVQGLFGGLRVRLALALSLHIVTSDHIQSGVAPYGCARPLSRRVMAPYHARLGLFGGALCVCLPVRPPLVASRCGTVPCLVGGPFDSD